MNLAGSGILWQFWQNVCKISFNTEFIHIIYFFILFEAWYSSTSSFPFLSSCIVQKSYFFLRKNQGNIENIRYGSIEPMNLKKTCKHTNTDRQSLASRAWSYTEKNTCIQTVQAELSRFWCFCICMFEYFKR